MTDGRITRVLAGESVVANVGKRNPDPLVEWAKQRGLLVYIGNKGTRHQWPQSIWGNPSKIAMHGEPNRAQVIASYRQHLEQSPGPDTSVARTAGPSARLLVLSATVSW